MPRPIKCRKVCGLPAMACFCPESVQPDGLETVVMTVDEYETVRLIDLKGYTQQDCASQMQVARTTVQKIYDSARRKLADSIVNGKRLQICGGDYRVCGGCTAHGAEVEACGRCGTACGQNKKTAEKTAKEREI